MRSFAHCVVDWTRRTNKSARFSFLHVGDNCVDWPARGYIENLLSDRAHEWHSIEFSKPKATDQHSISSHRFSLIDSMKKSLNFLCAFHCSTSDIESGFCMCRLLATLCHMLNCSRLRLTFCLRFNIFSNACDKNQNKTANSLFRFERTHENVAQLERLTVILHIILFGKRLPLWLADWSWFEMSLCANID